MWKRLQPVFWIFSLFILLGCGTGVTHAAQVEGSRASDSPPGTFNKFVGTWVAHGAFLVVASDGSVKFEARTYNWCGPQVAQPCDFIKENTIFYGYHEQLALTNANDSIAYGTVIASNDPPEKLNTPITLTLGPNDTLYYASQASITVLCGPAAPAGTCGA